MDDVFQLPVNYDTQELLLDSRLLQFGYQHKFEVNVNGIAVLFEPDEEYRYRALISPELAEKESKKLNPQLLQAIASQLEALHNN
ncbi:hypothetical protein [Mucilaginibacter lacusdianchii]|uniref:hypothetical protein n=1 Tax=Mucilaginibacter lacusdianchii TaxID=2684211 RepID=UPI00131D2F4C|nr:hypothetical protein [Mucilaginibacter sp. JXJ CY 39]